MISVGVLFPAISNAQINPYRLVEAPKPPTHLNAGRWGEMIQVRVGPEENVYVYHRCFKVVLGDPSLMNGHTLVGPVESISIKPLTPCMQLTPLQTPAPIQA
ncbi:MAG: hypothetical protein OXU24_10390 [Gammaproteobacteria bacterium]|nr:hypothetical protein [Gammaproteobacteria bacterium]